MARGQGWVVGEKFMPKTINNQAKTASKRRINRASLASPARLQEFLALPVSAIATASIKMTYPKERKE